MLTSAGVECTENKKIIVSIHMKTYCPLIKINYCKYFILVYHFRNQTLEQEPCHFLSLILFQNIYSKQ